MQCRRTRRQWLSATASALSGAWLAGSPLSRAAQAPTAPVAVSRCKTYNPGELLPALETMFDQLGGLGRLVFGFSRGAYTARSLSGFISKCGLLQRGAPLGVNQLYKRYRR